MALNRTMPSRESVRRLQPLLSRNAAEPSHAALSRNDTVVGDPLEDVTSSSLNAPGSASTEPNPDRQGEVDPAVNFGLITLDWSAQPPTVTLAVRGETGTIERIVQVPLTALTSADSPQPWENLR